MDLLQALQWATTRLVTLGQEQRQLERLYAGRDASSILETRDAHQRCGAAALEPLAATAIASTAAAAAAVVIAATLLSLYGSSPEAFPGIKPACHPARR